MSGDAGSVGGSSAATARGTEPTPKTSGSAYWLDCIAVAARCAFGLCFWMIPPLPAMQLSHAVVRSIRANGGDGKAVPRLGAGWMVLAMVSGGVLFAIVITSAVLFHALVDERFAPLVALSACTLFGALVSPVLFTPFVIDEHDRGVLASLMFAFVLGSRLGAARLALVGAACGALSGAGCVLPFVLLDGGAFLACMPLGGAMVGLCVMGVARVFMRVTDAADVPPEQGSGALRRPLLFMVPTALFFAATFVAAALWPTRVYLPAQGRLRAATSPVGAEGLALGGDRGLSVRVDSEGRVFVEVADGGGAGRIGLPHGGPWVVRAGETRFEDAPAFAILLVNDDSGRAFVTYVDADGVRLDDGLGARVGSRLGSNGVALLVAALVFFALGVTRAMRRRNDAELLAAEPATGRSGEGMLALEGVLRLGPSASLSLMGAQLSVHGDVQLVDRGGDARVALPPGEIELLGAPPDAPPGDGDRACVIGRFGSLRGLDFRSGASAWPQGAKLLLGPREVALAYMADEAARLAAPLLVVSWLSLAASALIVVVGL